MVPSDATKAADEFVDSDHALVAQFVADNRGQGTLLDQLIHLYYAVRDGFYYSPWGVVEERSAFRASAVLSRDPRVGHCIDKALLLAACGRYLGIPSRLRFANVRNHLGTADFEAELGSDLLVFHGYVEFFFDGRWVAATPAFNRELCEKLGVAALEFDGSEDSVFQEFDRRGGLFMEYVHDYGSFDELPYELMIAEWRKHYPAVARSGGWPRRGAR